MRRDPRVGIEKIWAYPGTQYLDLLKLAEARGHDPADLRDNLLVLSRSVNPLWEDPVTMAVNAAEPMLDEADRQAIELIIVATESSVDQGKAMSTYAQHFLRVPPNCRNFETKHACYGGTSALMSAAHWVASGLYPGKKALVISSDQSRMHLHKPYEYVMGAGAVAMLVSEAPHVLELELRHNGYWTTHVQDTFRPTSRVETGNGEASLYCYIDALEGAFAHFCSKAGDVDYDAYFKKHLYHVPFGGITFQAHRTLMRGVRKMKKRELMEHFQRTSGVGLTYNSQLGGTYGGSTFIALMGLLDACDDLQAGDRISIFSYGSGSCGEFYSARIGDEAKARVAAADLRGLIAARREISVEQYESVERARFEAIDRGDFKPDLGAGDGLYGSHYEGQRKLIFKGLSEHYRDYGWS